MKQYVLKLAVRYSLTVRNFSTVEVKEIKFSAKNDFYAFGRVHECISEWKDWPDVIEVDFISLQLNIGDNL